VCGDAGDVRDPRCDRGWTALTVRVLLVSQYFAPEVGATQNRMQAFADAIRDAGHEVTVICEQPNHPAGVFHEGYGRLPLRRERGDRLTVNRLWVVTSPRKTTWRRLLFYGTFAAGAFALTAATPSYDIVLATSPPLPGALGAALAARLRRVPLVLDVRDLWPAAAEALGELSSRRALRAFERAERWLYRSSAAVTATTRPFCHHIDAVAGREVATHIPNGALDALVALPERPPPAECVFRIGYFGNFGIAQGLGVVIDAAKELADRPIEFLLMGAGPVEAELRARIDELGLTNVVMAPMVETASVGELLLSCHALLVPLRDHPLLEDFIPSKLYDAMAVGRPAIVAARGEAADFVTEHRFGVVIGPEDGAALARVARQLAMDPGYAARLGAAGKAACAAYARSAQAATLCRLLESLVSSRRPPSARHAT
jgi:glycosyltransferase involved in cell wall biosynthesis